MKENHLDETKTKADIPTCILRCEKGIYFPPGNSPNMTFNNSNKFIQVHINWREA